VSENRARAVTLLIILAVLLVAGIATWLIVTRNNQENEVASPAMQALSTTGEQDPYTDLEGNPMGLTGYVGTVLVVSTWASWCPSCVDSLKELSLLAQAYPPTEVKILAINRSDPANIAKAFLRKYGISSDVQLVLDGDDRFFKSIDGYTMPETVIYDPDGNVLYHKHGVTTLPEMKNQIDTVLSDQKTQ